MFCLPLLILGGNGLSAADKALPPAVGDEAKDFKLKDLAGEAVQLHELTQDGPVVVVLRGCPGYQCPVCSAQVGKFSPRR